MAKRKNRRQAASTTNRSRKRRRLAKGKKTAEVPEIERVVPAEVRALLEKRDGAALVVEALRRVFPVTDEPPTEQAERAWELCGLHYLNQTRFHEALPVFLSLYDYLLAWQQRTGVRRHKGTPLVWISECHRHLGRPALAKRYLMLTAVEDAIIHKGEIPAEHTGAYFRMVWILGMSDDQVKQYAKESWRLHGEQPVHALFPEWVLQQLGQEWMTEFPTPAEAGLYVINARYLQSLLTRLGEGDGKALEEAAHYLLSAIPGCRAYVRKGSESTDYDVVGVFEGIVLDFRSEFGRYVLCECKDWATAADFTMFAKFATVLDSVRVRFGVLFSRYGITGEERMIGARREQVKLYQRANQAVVVLTEADLQRLAAGENFIALLKRKYEEVRLDLRRLGDSAEGTK